MFQVRCFRCQNLKNKIGKYTILCDKNDPVFFKWNELWSCKYKKKKKKKRLGTSRLNTSMHAKSDFILNAIRVGQKWEKLPYAVQNQILMSL